MRDSDITHIQKANKMMDEVEMELDNRMTGLKDDILADEIINEKTMIQRAERGKFYSELNEKIQIFFKMCDSGLTTGLMIVKKEVEKILIGNIKALIYELGGLLSLFSHFDLDHSKKPQPEAFSRFNLIWECLWSFNERIEFMKQELKIGLNKMEENAVDFLEMFVMKVNVIINI